MTDFQSAFDTNTSGINTTLTTQLSSVQKWANIPGYLVKASSSAAGYLWGFNSANLVYVCQQPCTGNWTEVNISALTPPPPRPPPPGLDTSGLTDLGCWNDTNSRALSGPPGQYGYTVQTCKEFALSHGSSTFGVQNGGQCFIENPGDDYKKHGKYTGPCAERGGVWVNHVYQVPQVPPPPPPPPQSPPVFLDIATDETNVYILFSSGRTTSLATKTANNQTNWSIIPIGNGFSPANVFSTHTYLWLQSATNQKVKIPKPINMTNTMPVNDTSVKITSASSSALYGIDASGQAMKSDETLQTGWAPVAGLQGKPVSSVVGDLDQTGLFAITGSGVSECVGDCSTNKTVPINTQGYLPLYLTGDPSTKQLWMTTSTAGSLGNIFNRIANPDYSSISNSIAPLDRNRDGVVTDVTKDYNKQTQIMGVNQELSMFKSLFTQLFGDATKAQTDANTRISQVETDLQNKKKNLDQLSGIQPIIQKFVVTLAITALVYAVFSPFGWYVHAVALVVLVIGIYLTLNNDVTLSSLWSRLP